MNGMYCIFCHKIQCPVRLKKKKKYYDFCMNCLLLSDALYKERKQKKTPLVHNLCAGADQLGVPNSCLEPST